MKLYQKGTIRQDRLKNLTLKLKRLEEQTETVYSVGGLIDGYGIYELVKPTLNKPCFAVQLTNKPIAYLKEAEIPNQKLIIKPLERVPWLLCTEPEEYGTTEQLFNEIVACLSKHLETSRTEDINIIASWIMLTWQIEKFETTPYLQFFGIFESGKTRALEMLQQLAFRGWLATGITSANLYRPIETWKPTLLLDESETFITKPEILGLLNSGYKRGLIVPRQTQTPDGEWKTEWYDLFCPKAIAGTEDLGRTTKSRCITFVMHKATRKIPLFINKKQCATLRNKLLKWRFNMLLSEPREPREPFSEGGYEEITEKLQSGRLAELFLPLYMTVPQQQNQIIEYAQTISQQRELELSISEEVVILEAILQCSKLGFLKNRLIRIKTITDRINQQSDYQELWSNQRVGQIIARLGFERQHTNRGNALIWNENLIKKLEADPRYKSAFKPTEIEDNDKDMITHLEKPSQGSQPSPEEWVNQAEDVKQ